MLSPQVVSRIAANWREAAHEPHHPSYQLFAAECYNQFLSLDCTITPYSTGSPYQTIQEMFEDIDRNKHLHVYVCGSPLAPEHPLAQPTPEGTLNVWFRAIHDIHGHFQTRSDF